MAVVALLGACGRDGESPSGASGHVAFVRDGDGAAVVMNVASGDVIRTVDGPFDSVSLSPTRQHLALLDPNGNATIVEIATGSTVSYAHASTPLHQVFWSPTGAYAYYHSRSGQVFAIPRTEESRLMSSPVRMDANGESIAYLDGPEDARIVVHEAVTGQERHELVGLEPRALRGSYDGHLLIEEMTDTGSAMALYDRTGVRLAELPRYARFPAIDLRPHDTGPSGERLLIAYRTLHSLSADGTAVAEIAAFDVSEEISSASYLGNGDIVVAINENTDPSMDDTPEYEAALYVLSPSGERRVIVAGKEACFGLRLLDAEAQTAVFGCYEGDEVYDLESGELLVRLTHGQAVGLTENASAVVYTEAGDGQVHLLWRSLSSRGDEAHVLGHLRVGNPPYSDAVVSYAP